MRPTRCLTYLVIFFLFIISSFFLPGVLAATPPTVDWSQTYGGPDSDEGRAVQETTDGGYIIVGTSDTSFGTDAMWNYDVNLIKTDSEGTILWNRTFGGSDWEGGYSVQQTTDGGYIIAGYTESFGAGDSDVYLVKTDSVGNELWSQTFGGSDYDFSGSVHQTMDGGYILTGQTWNFGAIEGDIYLIKTDSDGTLLWDRTFGGSDREGGYSVQQTTDGGYIIAGYTESFGAGDSDVYLVKTDSVGNELWSQTFGGYKAEGGFSVQQTTDGGYIVSGYTNTFGPGYSDLYLIKTTSDGEAVWTQAYGGPHDDGGLSVQQTMDGGYIIAGYSYNDVYIVKTDTEGNMYWNRTLGGSGNDGGYSVQQTTDGGYIITGYTGSFGNWKDVYLIKTGEEAPASTLNEPPTASMTYTPESPTSSDIIEFQDVSEDSDGIIISWFWEFGDGSTSTDENPTHQYQSHGNYTVTLTVTDDEGVTDSSSAVIDVSAPDESLSNLRDLGGVHYTQAPMTWTVDIPSGFVIVEIAHYAQDNPTVVKKYMGWNGYLKINGGIVWEFRGWSSETGGIIYDATLNEEVREATGNNLWIDATEFFESGSNTITFYHYSSGDGIGVKLRIDQYTETHELSVSTMGSGTTNPAPGTHTKSEGVEISVDAIPDSGWALDYWLLDDVDAGSIHPFTVTMDQDHTLTAVFTPSQRVLTVSVIGSGSTDPAAGTFTYNVDSQVQVTATPASGWVLDYWLLDSVDVGSANPYTVTMGQDHTLTAVIVQNTPPALTEDGFFFSMHTIQRSANPDIFRVRYTDLENNPPQYIELVIDGDYYEIDVITGKEDISDDDYTDGVTYYLNLDVTVAAPTKTLSFFFICSDGVEETKTDDQTIDVISSGFTPEENGYSFRNEGDVFEDPDSLSKISFPTLYNIAVKEGRAFGIVSALNRYGKGLCYGMTYTSILYYQDKNRIPAGKTRVYDLNIATDEGLYDDILRYHYTQPLIMRDELTAGLSFEEKGAYYELLKDQVENGPWVLGVSHEDGKHAVVVYKIVESEYSAYLYIYDPNYPWAVQSPWASGDEYFIGEVNLLTWAFEYELYTKFSILKPVNNMDRTYFEFNFIAIAHSPVDVHVYDEDDNHVGLDNRGELEIQIPGAHVEEVDGDLLFIVPGTAGSLRWVIDGTDSGSYSFDLSIPTNEDSLKIFNVNTTTTANSVDTLKISSEGNLLEISTVENEKVYSLSVSSLGGTTETFTLTDVEIDSSATHSYTVNDWYNLETGDNPLSVSVDEDSDGIADYEVDLHTGIWGESVEDMKNGDPLQRNGISCSVSSSEITLGESVTVEVNTSVSVQVTMQVSTDDGAAWSDLTTVTTASDGTYSYTWKPYHPSIGQVGSYQLRAYSKENSLYAGIPSNIVPVTVNKIHTEISCYVSPTKVAEGSPVTVSGYINSETSFEYIGGFEPYEMLLGAPVTLLYMLPDGSTLNRTVKCLEKGLNNTSVHFSDTYNPNIMDKLPGGGPTGNPDPTGEYSVTVSWNGGFRHEGAAGLATSFELTRAIEISNLQISPNPVSVEKTITISADVENTGEKEGTVTLYILLDDEQYDSAQELKIAPREKQTVTFEVIRSTEGVYEVLLRRKFQKWWIAELEGTFQVNKRRGIPGFTHESMALGYALGTIVLLLLRRKQQPCARAVDN